MKIKIPEELKPHFVWWKEREEKISMYIGIFVVGLLLGVVWKVFV